MNDRERAEGRAYRRGIEDTLAYLSRCPGPQRRHYAEAARGVAEMRRMEGEAKGEANRCES